MCATPLRYQSLPFPLAFHQNGIPLFSDAA
jgi:hypothetical protein